MVCQQKKYLLAFVGYLAQYVKEFAQILQIEVILGGAETDEINKVLLVVQSHVELVLAEHIHEDKVGHNVVPPILHLSLALESDSIKLLGVHIVSLKQLKDSREEGLWISWILIQPSSQTIHEHVLILSLIIKIANQRSNLCFEGDQITNSTRTRMISLLLCN